MTPESKPGYRRLRNGWGMLLMLAWVIYWYVHLDAQQAAAIAAMENCDAATGVSWVKCNGAQAVERGSLAFGFGLKLFFAVVSAPFMFIVSHYLARTYFEQQEHAADRHAAADIAAAHKRQQSETAARIAASEASAKSSRDTIGRAEFIQKMGSVSDLLALLPGETDIERVLLIQQGISKELRELTAKHPLPVLEGMVRKDEAIALTLKGLLSQLRQASVSADAATILEAALQRGMRLV